MIVPLKRSRKPVAHKARGVGVGMFWAMTPLVGIQMPLVFLTWLVLRWHKRTDFHLVIALAWTWVSNVFTMLPMYYAFYVTGQVVLLRWDDMAGYEAFTRVWDKVLEEGNTLSQTLRELLILIAQEQGLAMCVGCVPWAVLFSWLSYKWSLKYLIAHHERRFGKTKADAEPAPPSDPELMRPGDGI